MLAACAVAEVLFTPLLAALSWLGALPLMDRTIAFVSGRGAAQFVLLVIAVVVVVIAGEMALRSE
jgi:hypothetical protein